MERTLGAAPIRFVETPAEPKTAKTRDKAQSDLVCRTCGGHDPKAQAECEECYWARQY